MNDTIFIPFARLSSLVSVNKDLVDKRVATLNCDSETRKTYFKSQITWLISYSRLLIAEKVKICWSLCFSKQPYKQTLRYFVRIWLKWVPIFGDAALYQNVTIHGKFWYDSVRWSFQVNYMGNCINKNIYTSRYAKIKCLAHMATTLWANKCSPSWQTLLAIVNNVQCNPQIAVNIWNGITKGSKLKFILQLLLYRKHKFGNHFTGTISLLHHWWYLCNLNRCASCPVARRRDCFASGTAHRDHRQSSWESCSEQRPSDREPYSARQCKRRAVWPTSECSTAYATSACGDRLGVESTRPSLVGRIVSARPC